MKQHMLMDGQLAPVSSFVFPSAEVIHDYFAKQEQTNPNLLSMSTVCGHPLGFYMVS
jgi:hypothetical protein